MEWQIDLSLRSQNCSIRLFSLTWSNMKEENRSGLRCGLYLEGQRSLIFVKVNSALDK
jgi:hypothetical protein